MPPKNKGKGGADAGKGASKGGKGGKGGKSGGNGTWKFLKLIHF